MRRSPATVGWLTVKLNDTACASAGIPHCPPIEKVRLAPAARAGGRVDRVSPTRQGVIVWYLACSEMHEQNSEVFPSGSVAVAVSRVCGETETGKVALKLALPDPLVVTCFEP